MKTALVTGSSRGIGRAVAVRLAADGYKVWIHAAANAAKAEETRRDIAEAGGAAAVQLADLRDLEQTKGLLEKTGDVDVLILNASLQYRTPWTAVSAEACREQLDCNFVSSLLLIQAAVPHMKAQKWGRIVTIGSVQERRPHQDMLVYAASKAAQAHLAKSLAVLLAGDGITVNNVAPGVIETDRNRDALADPAYAKAVMETIPAGFFGKPKDCAGIVSLLCSEEGRYITGQDLYVDGGKGLA